MTFGGRSLTATVLAALLLLTACGSKHPSLSAQYLSIANVGNRALEKDFDGLEGDGHDLTAARADLADAAATERRFDHALLGIAFPPPIEATARALIRVNEARATLTSDAAGVASTAQLARDRQQLSAADGPVEQQVDKLRAQLHLPPADTS